MAPKVSILIPCYNAGDWIEETVSSALDQDWPNCEVIVIDDGSSDRSPELLRKFSTRVRVDCRENRGGNQTRNELLERSTGDWIQFLDADDCLEPSKVRMQVETVRESPETDVVYSPLIMENHEGEQVSRRIWDPHDPTGNHDAWAYHLGWNLTQTGGALFRRKSLVAVGGWNEAQPRCQDNELFFRLLKAGATFTRCPHAGAVYRRFALGTVSTDNYRKLVDEILTLLEEGEQFLVSSDQMTATRRHAANQNRLSLARKLWKEEPGMALGIISRIHQSDPRFSPSKADHAPLLYRLAFRIGGFEAAERIASLKRNLFSVR
jgi:glycosyltransferase involved in cell wall biosynthesis